MFPGKRTKKDGAWNIHALFLRPIGAKIEKMQKNPSQLLTKLEGHGIIRHLSAAIKKYPPITPYR